MYVQTAKSHATRAKCMQQTGRCREDLSLMMTGCERGAVDEATDRYEKKIRTMAGECVDGDGKKRTKVPEDQWPRLRE